MKSPEPNTELNGKSVIVTGSGRGIGREIALDLGRNGANLVLTARTVNELESVAHKVKRLGVNVLVIRGDVSNENDVREVISATIKKYRRIDILVNNAGALGPVGALEDNDPCMWLKAVKVNLLGVFLFCKYSIPHMKRQKRGKIINISGAGAPSPYPMFSAYSASKTGVLGLTQTLAEELKGHNIQVNAVAPGLTDTKLQDEIIAAGPVAGDAYRKAMETRMKGGNDPRKTAELVRFLASGGSNGITGKFFSAKWDNWKSLKNHSSLASLTRSEMYTIRRIDGVFFRQLSE